MNQTFSVWNIQGYKLSHESFHTVNFFCGVVTKPLWWRNRARAYGIHT